jgi:hypothetical protein
VRGNFELGVVVGMESRAVLKGVRSNENGVCGFKCTLKGKLLLVGCESGDPTPYTSVQVLPHSSVCTEIYPPLERELNLNFKF